MTGNDFYEEDEPIADVVAAFGSRPRAQTARCGPPPRALVWVDDAGLCTLTMGVGGFSDTPTFAGRPMRRIA